MHVLGFDVDYKELSSSEGLAKLDKLFLEYLPDSQRSLLLAARLHPSSSSELILELAPYLEDFITELFNIRTEVDKLKECYDQHQIIYSCKRLFVQRKALKTYKESSEEEPPLADLIGEITELNYAQNVSIWLDQDNQEKLDIAARYAAWASFSISGRIKHQDSVLFKQPKKIDYYNLIPEIKLKCRDGFGLTDNGPTFNYALDQAHYCIYCHHQGKDSCSKGIKEKDEYKVNPLNVKQTGCPLMQKISEMNELKAKGVIIGAFAVIIIDNPMVAATGHRICNDCMKACIYQKQDPVNIPSIETHILNEVLALPWGFEIYNLLVKFNPLNFSSPYQKPNSNYKVLVVGAGPAGFTAAHYLLRDGHIVTLIDGLKIEKLDFDYTAPIRDVKKLYESLDTRIADGFGGVTEYGITVRWNKNYLKLIRIILMRYHNIRIYGGVRFGSNINTEDAFALGFNHIALALGAGRPNLPQVKNLLARGVRTASDFLMSLQLTGANRNDSIANLQVRLPIIVIGGGLTAIDTATEAFAYYRVQIKKFYNRYQLLKTQYGAEIVEQNWTPEEKIIAEEFINHARLIEGKTPLEEINIFKDQATLIYRGNFIDSPSYRLNSEEVEKALEEGISIRCNIVPKEILLDEYNHAKAILTDSGEVIEAKTILIATGTHPNTQIAEEESYTIEGRYFRLLDPDGNKITPEFSAKPKEDNFFTEFGKITIFGDLHPSFAGNVVKAMASSKRGSKFISKYLNDNVVAKHDPEFLSKLDNLLIAKIAKINILTPKIIEIVVHSTLAAEKFEPGQFYRLQNYKSKLPQMEGLALTGASVDKDAGLITLIVLEMGGSSNLCRYLQEGEEVVLMGPTGAPTVITANKNIMLVGGGLGNAVLFSIGKAFRKQNSKILYFAGYRSKDDIFKQSEIEAASDIVVWCADDGLIKPNRPQDLSFHGNIIQAIDFYAKQADNTLINLADINEIIAIGSDKMMEAVQKARHNILKEYLNPAHTAVASINSPMQCMMKEICAQCLQLQIDPVSGVEKYVYSCKNQDQDIDHVSFTHLDARLKQNSLQEKLTNLYLQHLITCNQQ